MRYYRGGGSGRPAAAIGGSYADVMGGRCMDSAAVSRSRGGGGEWRKWAVWGGWVISARERFGDVAHGSRVDSWSPRGGGALLRCPCPLAAVRSARLPDGTGRAGLVWAWAPGTRVSQSRRSTSTGRTGRRRPNAWSTYSYVQTSRKRR